MIFDARGWILTNDHVVNGATTISVALPDGRTFAARIVSEDAGHDLAVIKVSATGLPVVHIGHSTGLKMGQLVIAIGSPLGEFTDSVTTGIISAIGRSLDVGSNRRPHRLTNILQIDAPINPGNSGGPLLNAAGEVIGIVSANDPSAQGIAFAIPIDTARPIMQKALGGG